MCGTRAGPTTKATRPALSLSFPYTSQVAGDWPGVRFLTLGQDPKEECIKVTFMSPCKMPTMIDVAVLTSESCSTRKS